VGGEVALRPLGEDRDLESQEQVAEDREIALDRLAADLALSCHLGEVEHRAVGEADRFEEPREALEAPDQALQLDLFLEVQADVGLEDVLGLRGAPHQRHESPGERPDHSGLSGGAAKASRSTLSISARRNGRSKGSASSGCAGAGPGAAGRRLTAGAGKSASRVASGAFCASSMTRTRELSSS